MSKYKVCVYAICKNEEQFVDRWMDAVGEADLVVVTDTGSTDGTVARLRSRGAVVFEEKIRPWRFDVARNVALGHLPEDTDICVSNDLDEVFEKGWRAKLEEHWEGRHTRARYWFAWSHHRDGSIHKRYHMEKIHRRHGFRWTRPVHEILEYSGEDADEIVFIDDLILHHFPDNEKPRSQYLPLLELSVEENPQDDRAMFWLGREYFYYQQYEPAVRTLIRYLELPSARWAEERAAAMSFIAQAFEVLKDMEQARSWHFKAIGECPQTREAWLAMARFGYGQKDWGLVYFSVENALSIQYKTDSYLTDPVAWGFSFYDYGAISCYWLGMYEKALSYGLEAMKMSPGDQRLKDNIDLILDKYKKM